MFIIWSNDTYESKGSFRFISVMGISDWPRDVRARQLRRTALCASAPNPLIAVSFQSDDDPLAGVGERRHLITQRKIKYIDGGSPEYP
ncbi:hypothetical protein AGR7C_pAt0053 [Agrobacterium deltaense Zutra 3/1]|uniref:Uncharacterized protein n=1 Tax=Agrobacterium deltaense Zutra 3/1 TaxID=1183427 RepID=A0A1S7S391_9HYPH|nr:hypothetical protein AGR7C_pAt0053 [Agrobacterium deltaense Zutra 3/1]